MIEHKAADYSGEALAPSLDAGPDVDRLVEREIFGGPALNPRRFYSVDDAAAQRVIERMQALVPGARLRWTVENGMFRCEWWAGKVMLGSATSSRSALAVCVASLAARRSSAALASGQLLRRSAPVWSPRPGAPPSGGARPQ